MATSIPVALWMSELFAVLEETFERVQGIYLDKGTSLFETLATVTAEEASRRISPQCAPLSAQIDHVRYYLDVLAAYMRQPSPTNVDWSLSWQRGAVSAEEWDTLQRDLRASYEQVQALFKGYEAWDGEDGIGDALAIVAHTAYHLGEIRQALGVIR